MTRVVRPGMVCALALVLLGASLAWNTPRGHAEPEGRLASETPATWTPHVLGGPDTATPKSRVNAITKVGDTIVLGGTFTQVRQDGAVRQRNRLLAFDARSGELSASFTPDVGGAVETLAPAPERDAVYVGGSFATVNETRSRSLAMLDLATGELVSDFDVPEFNGRVRDLEVSGGRLFVAGHFTHVGGGRHDGLVTLDPQTGAVDPYVAFGFTGTHAGGYTSVREIDIAPDRERLVAVGNFTEVDGQHREQLAVLDIGGSSAALDPWHTSSFEGRCEDAFDSYLTDVAFSPGGSYFVVVTTGGGPRSDGALCDTATRWQTRATGTDEEPAWVAHTGKDTLTAVTIAGGAVYVGGHQRWFNNPDGEDSAGPGAVPRPGLAALDPGNGLPLGWNPGRIPRGYGVTDFFVGDNGLWVGSDTEWVGQTRYRRERIAFFPFSGGTVVPQATTARLPGDVYLLGASGADGGLLASPGSGSVPYRTYDGESARGAASVAAGGIDQDGVRGGALIGDTLWYGSADGEFSRRGFDGESFGDAAAPDPYAWPFRQDEDAQKWPGQQPEFYAALSSITGMFYADGRLYYTLSGESALYYRDFAPSSGVVGAQRSTASDYARWAEVRGMFRSGEQLYYATADGTLHRVEFAEGAPVTDTHAVASTDGNWAANALFLHGGQEATGGDTESRAAETATGGSGEDTGGADSAGGAEHGDESADGRESRDGEDGADGAGGTEESGESGPLSVIEWLGPGR